MMLLFLPGSGYNSILALLKLPDCLKYQNLCLKERILTIVLFSNLLLITFYCTSSDSKDHFLWHPKIQPVLKILSLFEHIKDCLSKHTQKIKGSQLIHRGMQDYMNTLILKFCYKNFKQS